MPFDILFRQVVNLGERALTSTYTPLALMLLQRLVGLLLGLTLER